MSRLLAPLTTLLALVLWSAPSRGDAPDYGSDIARNIQSIRANDRTLREDRFAKMGGSSVASHAFLNCFATPYVEFGEHDDLEDAVRFFAAQQHDSFSRESLAAGVSWNLRYVLGGRPAKFRREVAATDPRWALVLFGGNDSQNRNEQVYARRLVYLIEELVELGVVPVLGSASPRRSRSKDLWVRRFNAITEAVAVHWRLPYIDYYAAMAQLPKKGLAGDGVHPNVLGRGGVRAACQLTEQGLRYGNNVRNLLTIEALDSLRDLHGLAEPVLTDALPLHLPPRSAVTGERYQIPVSRLSGHPVFVDALPYSAVIDKAELVEPLDLPEGCSRQAAGAKGLRVTIEVSEPQRIRATALDLEGAEVRLYWAQSRGDVARCLKRRGRSLEVASPAGTWDLFVEVPERAAEAGSLLLLIYRELR